MTFLHGLRRRIRLATLVSLMLAMSGALLVVGLAGCSSNSARKAGVLEIPLVYRPRVPSVPSTSFASSMSLTVTDQRTDKTAVGENVEEAQRVRIVTTGQPATFVDGLVRRQLEVAGVKLLRTGAEQELKLALVKFWTRESDNYNCEIALRAELCGASGKTIWSGTASGTSTNFGRSLSAENYWEVISDATNSAVGSILSNRDFIAAVRDNAAHPVSPTVASSSQANVSPRSEPTPKPDIAVPVAAPASASAGASLATMVRGLKNDEGVIVFGVQVLNAERVGPDSTDHHYPGQVKGIGIYDEELTRKEHRAGAKFVHVGTELLYLGQRKQSDGVFEEIYALVRPAGEVRVLAALELPMRSFRDQRLMLFNGVRGFPERVVAQSISFGSSYCVDWRAEKISAQPHGGELESWVWHEYGASLREVMRPPAPVEPLVPAATAPAVPSTPIATGVPATQALSAATPADGSAAQGNGIVERDQNGDVNSFLSYRNLL